MTDLHKIASGDGHTSAALPTLDAPQRKPLVPPHIAWPAFVVLLLLTGVGSAFQALFASQSDGGVQLAADYGAAASEVVTSAWTASATVGGCEGGLCTVELTVLDADDAPVRGLVGTVTATREAGGSGAAHTLPLAPTDRPGVYVQAMPVSAPGGWRFEVDAWRGPDRLTTRAEATR